MGMKKIEKKLVFILLLAMVFNIFAPFAGINEEKIYAEDINIREEGEDLLEDYFPDFKTPDFSGWKMWTRNGTNNYLGNFGAAKADGFYTLVKKSQGSVGINIEAKPEASGYRIKVGEPVADGNIWIGGPSIESSKEFKDKNIYRLHLNIEKKGKDDGTGTFNFKDLNTQNQLTRKNITLLGEINSNVDGSWRYYKKGAGYADYIGRGGKVIFTPETLPVKGKSSEYIFSNFKLENITPASKPVIDETKTSLERVEGQVIKVDGDERSNFKGDLVQIFDEDKKIGQVLVNEQNTWSYEFEEPIKDTKKISYKVVNPESGKVSEIIGHPDIKEKGKITEAEEGKKVIKGISDPGNDVIYSLDGVEKASIVKEDGTFEITLDKHLKPGQRITLNVYEKESGIKLDNIQTVVEYKEENHKVKLDENLKAEDTSIKGKGFISDQIIVKDVDGNELGSGTVYEDGNFNVELNRPLKENEMVKIESVTKVGSENKTTFVEESVLADENKLEVDEDTVKEGSEEIKGKGRPGDEIVITDKDGKELGKGTVDEDGNFKIELERPLKPGDELTLTPNTDGKEGTPLELGPVEYDKELHKPNIENAIGGGEKVTGTGVEGDNIVITDEEGKELGRGIVRDDGKFEIDLTRPLEEGEKIKAQAVDGENKSEETKVTVTYEAKAHKPELNEVKEGDTSITGKGTPGDTIVITDEEGNKLGEGIVGDDGNFEIKVENPLKPGKIIATPITGDNEGELAELDIDLDKEKHKPEVDADLKEGDTSITGKGQPGDEIIVKDKDGNELGKGTVDEDGNFTIDLDKPLEEGKIELIPKTDEKEGSPLKKEVEYNPEYHKPEVDEDPKEGDTSISGKGQPGDEIVIKDKDGKELGKGEVDEDGNFKVDLNRPLKPGDELTLTPKTGDKEGTPLVFDPVEYDKDLHKPNIENAIGGEEKVTGKGVPGDEVIITDKDGNELGKGEVDGEGNFKIEIDRPLKEGEEITAKAKTGEEESEETKVTVTYEAFKHKPTLNPAKEGDTKVTGVGVPGDEIIITDENGKELGRGKVDDNGKFEITVGDLMAGKLTATPVTNGNEGEKGEGDVSYNPAAHKPNIEKAKEGEKEVTGKGVPGDEIIIRDKDGNELGKGMVDKDGNFKIDLDRPLNEGEEVTAKAKTGDKESEDTKVIVTYEAEKHKPKLDSVEEGDKKLTGTGTPGDEIIVKDKDGNELGRGKVDKDGKFEINLDKPLKPGKITATPVTGNNEGESLEVEVKDKDVIIPEPEKPIDPEEPPFDKDKHKPEVEEIQDGDKIVSGKGVPGDTITILDRDGKEIGKTQVDKNGNFKVELTRPVKEGELIVVKPTTDGKEGTETLVTVKPKEEETVYDKLNSEDHIAYIKGFVNGTVRPNQTITREEVAAVIYRLLKPSYRDTIKTTSTSFKDVSPKRWSRKHIGTLENGNVVNGTGNGNFSPERKITKAEVIVMLSRLEKLDTRPNNDFTDIKGHWAEAEIKSAANKGWINGNQLGRFEPDKHLTRAEFVTIMNNVLNRRVEEKDILAEAKGFKDLKKDKWYYEAMMEAINSHHYERKDNGFEKWTDIYYPNLDM